MKVTNKIMLASVATFTMSACGGGGSTKQASAQPLPIETVVDAGAIIDVGTTVDPNILVDIVPGNTTKSHFLIKIKTDHAGTSSDVEFEIPTFNNLTYNYNVDCDNDGKDEATGESANYTCQYDKAGTYTIAIKDNAGDGTGFPAITFVEQGDNEKLLEIIQWGASKWQSMKSAFYGCKNMTLTATDEPNLALVKDMSYMFAYAKSLNQDLNYWNVSTVTNMSGMFSGATSYNQSLVNWNVSKVTNMAYMFSEATSFNQPVAKWDVSNVVNMEAMFSSATSFNQSVEYWDVSKVSTMAYMFSYATSYDQSLGDWEPYLVTSMKGMFKGAGLSSKNYEDLLTSWADKANKLQDNVEFHAGSSKISGELGNVGAIFARIAKDSLVNGKGWDITDSQIVLPF